MDQNGKRIIADGDALFGKRSTLMSLWQETAMNCYIERADFTTQRTMGVTFAENLMTGVPSLCRRELGDQLGAMLRPKEKEWFFCEAARMDTLDNAGRKWLEVATGAQRRAMYAKAAKLVRACKEADHDFAAFGQAVLSVEMNARRDDFLYRSWHLRDVAWCEDDEGNISDVHRKYKAYPREIARKFPDTVSARIKDLAEKHPYEQVECRHVVLPSDAYDPVRGTRKRTQKWVSIYLEQDGTVLEEVPSRSHVYVIPRWQTVSGSQYAYSPATVVSLPDMRLLQSMTLTLMEAGEQYTNPPKIAVQDAIRSDIQVFAGGVTWVDAEYDERLGEVLRPLTQDKSGFPIGRDMRADVVAVLQKSFYLDKLSFHPGDQSPQKTAFQVGQEVQEYIRSALPIFEPMEQDYNGGLCDLTFDLGLHNGLFGSLHDMPPSLRGADVVFRMESPLTELIDTQKAQKLANAKALLAQVADVDPTTQYVVDWKAAFRDALQGNRTPEIWIHDPAEADGLAQRHAQAAQQAAMLQRLEQSSNIAKNLGAAGASFQQAGAGDSGAQPAAGVGAA